MQYDSGMDSQYILVPVDFSPASETAARLAASFAARSGARVSLVHVEPQPGAAILTVEPIVIPPAVWEEVAGRSREAGAHRLDEMRADLLRSFPDLEISTEVLRGAAVEVILDAGKDAQLVVMGSHGSTGAERLFFGSVAESVSRQSHCPVLVTRADARDQFKHVVAGVDLGADSVAIATLAKDFVAKGGTLELVYVLPLPVLASVDSALSGTGGRLQELVERAREQAVEAMDELVAEVSTDVVSVSVEGVIESGRVEDALLEHGEKAGLVVVGAHSREQLRERVLGTTADRVLRHSKVPVLLFPATR